MSVAHAQKMKMYDSLDRKSPFPGVKERMRRFIKGVNDQKHAKLRKTNAKCPKQEVKAEGDGVWWWCAGG